MLRILLSGVGAGKQTPRLLWRAWDFLILACLSQFVLFFGVPEDVRAWGNAWERLQRS